MEMTNIMMDEKELCENCQENSADRDGLVDGEFKRLCGKCSLLDNAVILEGRSNVDISKINARRTVKEILIGMSGIKGPGIKKKEVHLDDLRRVKNSLEGERKNFDEQLKHINDPDESKPWSKWVRGNQLEVTKNKRPSPQGVKLDDVSEDEILNI